MATFKNTTIDDTGFLQFPSGTTAQRPASPLIGMVRWNTDDEALELYNGTEWAGIASGKLVGTGGTLTVSGGYNTHTFTSIGNSTFTIS